MKEMDGMKLPHVAAEIFFRLERSAPLLVLFISLAITHLLWMHAHNASLQEQRNEFDSMVSDVNDRLHRHMLYYEQVLHGARGFYLYQHEMERQEFRGYIESLEIEKKFPGIQGVSFAPLIPSEHKSAHIAAMRRTGVPEFNIQPEGKRNSYAPVSFIEPMNNRNVRALGFDNLSSPARTATIEQARDEDRAVISEKLTLRQENEQAPQAGFLMFLPVYKQGSKHDTLTARRANIVGWFAASFRMADMVAGIFDERCAGLGMAVFDGLNISEQSLMYAHPDNFSQHHAPLFSSMFPVKIAEHQWTLQFFSTQEFEVKRDKSPEHEALAAGGLLGVLLTAITWLLMRDRKRVLLMTEKVARELDMRKQAENQTADLYRFNEAILEKSPSGIAVYRKSGPCVMANDAYAKLIGATIEDVLKQDFRNNESWKRNGLLGFANLAFDTGETIRRDVEGITSFGKKVMLECIVASIAISEQPHLLLIINDISDRAAAEHALTESIRQLEQKELAKTRFLAAAGHDLRQPVAAANLFIDALKLTEATPRQTEIIRRLDQSMETFTGLLDALLNVSKLDAGIIKPEITSINVTEIFNWLEQNFAPMTRSKNLGFRLYFPMNSSLVIRGDLGLIRSVLMNLVTNAIKFTSTGGIMVSARRRGNEVLFQVWDTGMGIPAEYLEQIFDEFYQVNNPQRDRSGGLGLGLSIAKRALTLLHSKIACRSIIGRGSVFEFRLPLDASPEGIALLQLANKNSPPSDLNTTFAQGKRFVVVEDDVLVAQAMLSWLESMGGIVKHFVSAEDALMHAETNLADYYIADFMLGGKLNGIQFLNRVRNNRGGSMSAVVVTGDTSKDFIRHAVKCDWPVLHKPINTQKLISELSAQARSNAKSA
jgi:PAS domain S-box-containing protein